MGGQITMLILFPPKFRKGISQIKKHLVLLFTLNSFGATRIQINAFLSGSGSGSGAGIEVDPDPAKCSGSGWIRIRIRNAGYKFTNIELTAKSLYFNLLAFLSIYLLHAYLKFPTSQLIPCTFT